MIHFPWFLSIFLLLLANSSQESSYDYEDTKRDVLPYGMRKGIIGKTIGEARKVDSLIVAPSKGECRWFGTAPYCRGECPDSSYELIRKHTGRCSDLADILFKDSCLPDPTFGSRCSFKSQKAFCCKRDPEECSWEGTWHTTAISEGQNFTRECIYQWDADRSLYWNRCGSLACNGPEFGNAVEITGNKCNTLLIGNLVGKAKCGLISWWRKDKDGKNAVKAGKWYKSGPLQ